MIDARDLMVGSLVQYQDQLRVVREIGEEGYIRTSTPNKKQYFNFTHVKEFSPILITAEWLTKLGFKDEGPTWPYGWQFDAQMMGHLAVIQLEDQSWVLQNCVEPCHLATLTGIHHLQALIWNLEKVSLTLQPAQP